MKEARGGGWVYLDRRHIPRGQRVDTAHSSPHPWRKTANGWKLNADWEHLRRYLPDYNKRTGWNADQQRLHDYIVLLDFAWPTTPDVPEEVFGPPKSD